MPLQPQKCPGQSQDPETGWAVSESGKRSWPISRLPKILKMPMGNLEIDPNPENARNIVTVCMLKILMLRTWLRRHWTALILVLLSFQMYCIVTRYVFWYHCVDVLLPYLTSMVNASLAGSRSTTDFTETCYPDATPEEDGSRHC